MSSGSIVEFGKPKTLLSIKDGYFTKLVEQSGSFVSFNESTI